MEEKNMLNKMTVNKMLDNGNYKGTITGYDATSDTHLIVRYEVEGTPLSNTIDYAVSTDNGVWNKVQTFIDTLGRYHYDSNPINLLNYIIENKVPLNVAVNKGRYAQLLPPDAPLTTEKQIIQPSASPARKARA